MRIMICESSAVVRSILQKKLESFRDFEVLSSVSNCTKVLDIISSQRPDVIICGNSGDDQAEKNAVNIICNEHKIPLLILASENSGEEEKASHSCFLKDAIKTRFSSARERFTPSAFIDYFEKPNLQGYTDDFFVKFIKKLKEMASERDQLPESRKAVSDTSDSGQVKTCTDDFKLLCIGASTGGPSAVSEVLSSLGSDFPLPILYTQHIDINKDKNLTDWLQDVCKNLKVKLAEDGEKALPGTVYMAPADRHLVIAYICDDGLPVLRLSDEEPERFLRPAVNKLFRSAAQKYKSSVLALLLTGMGADGAEGCRMICDNGGWTIVEDKSTCAVFGMPAAAIECGGAKEVLPRNEIAKRIVTLVDK